MQDGAGEKPQRHLGRQIGESRRLESDRTALAPWLRRQRIARSADGNFNGLVRSPHARRESRQPVSV